MWAQSGEVDVLRKRNKRIRERMIRWSKVPAVKPDARYWIWRLFVLAWIVGVENLLSTKDDGAWQVYSCAGCLKTKEFNGDEHFPYCWTVRSQSLPLSSYPHIVFARWFGWMSRCSPLSIEIREWINEQSRLCLPHEVALPANLWLAEKQLEVHTNECSGIWKRLKICLGIYQL